MSRPEARWSPMAQVFLDRLECSKPTALMFADLWIHCGWFDADDINAWLDAGAVPEDARLVGHLVDAGITLRLAFSRIRFNDRTLPLWEHVKSKRMTVGRARAELARRGKLPAVAA